MLIFWLVVAGIAAVGLVALYLTATSPYVNWLNRRWNKPQPGPTWTCPDCGQWAFSVGGPAGWDHVSSLRDDHTCPPSATFMRDATWAGPSGH